MGVTIFSGLHDHLRADAARLYWDAFGSKLSRVLGPDSKAIAFFQRVIRTDHCLAALDESGDLIGVAGFKTASGSFAGGGWGDLIAIYGHVGGRWRGCILWALNRETDNDRFLVDGLCVDRDWRSNGIGSLLLAALYEEAARRGYHSIRLDVVDANWRARALYERQGFVATRTESLGLLRLAFGFESSTTMVRPLTGPDRG
jgi:ribosomal protein S18 acetylase RimI-like enzyme